MSVDDSSQTALQTMTHWVSAIADNIRNPMAGMAAALDILMRQLDQWKTTGACDEALIESAAQRMRLRFSSLHDYVTELVDFGRPFHIQRERVLMTDLLCSLTSELGGLAQTFGGAMPELQFALEPKDAWVSIDLMKMSAAFKALVRNAYEAAASRPAPHVRMSVERMERGGESSVVIHVDDNGYGFDPVLGTKVFDPFFSTKEAGTGLGLSMVRKYVLAHGGSVTLGHAPDLGGGRVTVSIPDPPDSSGKLEQTLFDGSL